MSGGKGITSACKEAIDNQALEESIALGKRNELTHLNQIDTLPEAPISKRLKVQGESSLNIDQHNSSRPIKEQELIKSTTKVSKILKSNNTKLKRKKLRLGRKIRNLELEDYTLDFVK